MLDVYNVAFLVYFRHIFHVIPTCPPAIVRSPKLMELINYKTLFLSVGVYLYKFHVKLPGKNMS